MPLTNDEKVILDRWYWDFKARIEELESEVAELLGATGGLTDLEERVTAIEKGIEKAMSRTGAEGTGKR